MSAFLGPIHIKMYGRILFQDDISMALLNLAEKNGWAAGLRALADQKAPAASTAPLDEIIDQSNIHGWLNQAVMVCEHRYALIVSGILSKHPERLAELQSALKDIGRQHRLPAPHDAEKAFQAIHDVLLDGMPCDFPFAVEESSVACVAWQVADCPHAPYWEAQNCDVETYYQLRDAWISGALEGSGILHSRADGHHALKKES